MTSPEIDRRIIESIRRFHRDGKPIYVYRLGMDCGLDPSIVSRWFRDRGIFWDHWRREWVAIIPELAGRSWRGYPSGRSLRRIGFRRAGFDGATCRGGEHDSSET